MRPHLCSAGTLLLSAMILVSSSLPAAAGEESDLRALFQFATEMATRGNWREARFRWERASKLRPADPRVLNNLAVCAEALGDPETARRYYREAEKQVPGDPTLADNVRRAARFWKWEVSDGTEGSARRWSPPGDGVRRRGGKRKKARKARRGLNTISVTVRLPAPARLDLDGAKTVLVASFLADESDLLDISRETARLLRGVLNRAGQLTVLSVTPPPAIPEQRLEDLAANAAFWKELGRDYGADLIVSGRVRFTRRDASGFRDVDTISPYTRQKVRRTQFVEQERFDFLLDLLFLDGRTGELRFQDLLKRSVVYGGQENDPITAFYEIGDSLAGDVRAVVEPQKREEQRVLFTD